jgi:phosphatidylglycerol:prolipoprotein diacylglycerol transferase
MMSLAINYPSWIHPEIFPGVPVLGLLRWYGLMYIFAFGTAYFILSKLRKEGELDSPGQTTTDDDLFSFFGMGVLFLLLGARIFSALVYDTSGLYRQKPWLIFWPFNEAGQFTGLAGMSFHGGVIGGLLGMVIWCLTHKRPLWKWVDAMAVAIPLGYTFGRIGNFLNGELYGRITTMPWGMIFPGAQRFSVSIPWVKDFVEQAGLTIAENARLINLPRHPSQLYEAFFEGIVLFVIMWFLRKKKPFDGFMTGMFLIGYGTFRFIIEYFREPDAEIGYIISVTDASTYINDSLLNISMGQVLCFLMIVGGIGLILARYFITKKQKEK